VTAHVGALTLRELMPAQADLMALFLELRAETDHEFLSAATTTYGKPYPYGFCREIAFNVLNRLRRRLTLSGGCPGLRALQAFQSAGGEIRCVWGVLRGTYFQTALQCGALYVDVANDTVVTTKPKVEILPMAESGLEAVRDAWHFATIAEAYWGMQIYANHAFPTWAPLIPMIGVDRDNAVSLQSASVYMASLFQRDDFRHAEAWLAAAPPPPPWVIAALRSYASPTLLAANPETGAEAALTACRSARERGLATSKAWLDVVLAECTSFHAGDGKTPDAIGSTSALERQPGAHSPGSEMQAVSNIAFDDRTFELDKLPEAAKAQVSAIQFVDAEIARLQAQLAAMQTARAAYIEALRKALPEA